MQLPENCISEFYLDNTYIFAEIICVPPSGTKEITLQKDCYCY
jgi:hypothetical protein